MMQPTHANPQCAVRPAGIRAFPASGGHAARPAIQSLEYKPSGTIVISHATSRQRLVT